VSDRLAEIEARRAARKASQEAARQEQRATDLEALDALEAEHGEVPYVDVAHPVEGLPTLAAGRPSKPAELKRYRSRIRVTKEGGIEGAPEAAEELALACLTYPSREVYDKLVAQRPGIAAALGGAIVEHASAKAREEGKG
jgi:hypothetical protein